MVDLDPRIHPSLMFLVYATASSIKTSRHDLILIGRVATIQVSISSRDLSPTTRLTPCIHFPPFATWFSRLSMEWEGSPTPHPARSSGEVVTKALDGRCMSGTDLSNQLRTVHFSAEETHDVRYANSKSQDNIGRNEEARQAVNSVDRSNQFII